MKLWIKLLTPAEQKAVALDRREKLAELADGAGVLALLVGIPVASIITLAVLGGWWFR